MYLAMVLIEYDSQFPCFFEMSIFYLLEDNDMWLCIYIWYVIVYIYIYVIYQYWYVLYLYINSWFMASNMAIAQLPYCRDLWRST